MNNIERACAYFEGIFSRNPAQATEYMDASRYVEHNPHVREGVEGVKEYVEQIAAGGPYLRVIRAFQDGNYVVTQGDGHIKEHCTFFDVFRFDDGLIVEHWAFSVEAGAPNKSGHTQVDGPTEARPEVDTEKSKSLAREYYNTVHIEGRHEVIPQYVPEDTIRHEPGVADGLAAFQSDLAILTKDRTIDEIVLVIGEGDFVFLAAKGTHLGDPCVYIDLYRIEDDQMMEHWGFPQQVPPLAERKNDIGML